MSTPAVSYVCSPPPMTLDLTLDVRSHPPKPRRTPWIHLMFRVSRKRMKNEMEKKVTWKPRKDETPKRHGN